MLTPTTSDLDDVVKELAEYHALFAPLFKRREQREWADVYLRGLLVADAPRKNIEAIALRLLGAAVAPDNRVRGLQQFVGVGGWDDEAILAKHRALVDETLGEDDGVLMIDGSDFPKQGKHSAGVARQWSGSLGKKANCQVGVFVGYASRQGYTLLERRLYLPGGWFEDDHQQMRDDCLIPRDVAFQTKPALAGDLIEKVVNEGKIRARWVVCDEDYGKDPGLLDKIATLDRWYLAEVACDTRVWPLFEPDGRTPRPRPSAWVPPQTPSGKGKAPTKKRRHPESPDKVRVDTWAGQIPAKRWSRYRIVEGSKGPLVADFATFRALAVRDGLPGPEVAVLVRRQVSEADDGLELKFYLSNAPGRTPLKEFVRVSGMRWPIESCFTEGKGYLGMDHYELRFWPGWHHHMTLVLLAHHFLVRLQRRLSQREGGPEAASRATGRLAGGTSHQPPGQAHGMLGLGPGGRNQAESRPSQLVAPRSSAPGQVRRDSRLGFARIPAAPQSGRLSIPSPAQVATPG